MAVADRNEQDRIGVARNGCNGQEQIGGEWGRVERRGRAVEEWLGKAWIGPERIGSAGTVFFFSKE